MRITVFTSNQPRHLSLIKELASVADEVFVVMEVNTIFPGQKEDFFRKTAIMQKYFTLVMESEKKFFGEISLLPANARVITIRMGDINDMNIKMLSPILDSDYYVVFGASYIKGDLIDFLIERQAYNIHMGVSPYYRGSSCNFWAGYDKNYHLIGATIHLLSKGLDSGSMLFHALPTPENTLFDLGMRSVRAAHIGLVSHIANGTIKDFKPIAQNRQQEIRYTKNIDFNDDVASKYLQTNISSKQIYEVLQKADNKLYLNPFFF